MVSGIGANFCVPKNIIDAVISIHGNLGDWLVNEEDERVVLFIYEVLSECKDKLGVLIEEVEHEFLVSNH